MRKIVIGLMGLLLGASTGLANEPAPARWNVDWGDHQCSLIRQVEQGPILAIRTTPGSMSWEMRVADRSWSSNVLANPDRITVLLQPGTALEARTVTSERSPVGHTLALYGLPHDFPETLAAARTVRLVRDGDMLLEIGLSATQQAIAALRDCEQDLMREWGIDPAVIARLRSPPTGDLARYVDNRDYPLEALRRGAGGTSTARIMVGVDGRVTECTIVATSGQASLDRATCRIFLRRAQLTPAIGPDGNPVAAPLITSLTWSIVG